MGQQEWIPRRREHLPGMVKLTGCVPMLPSYDAFVHLDHGALFSKRGATIDSGGRAFRPGRSGSPKPLAGAAAHLSSSDGLCASGWLGATGGPARALQNEAVRNDRWRWERGAGSVQLFPLTLTGPGTGEGAAPFGDFA